MSWESTGKGVEKHSRTSVLLQSKEKEVLLRWVSLRSFVIPRDQCLHLPWRRSGRLLAFLFILNTFPSLPCPCDFFSPPLPPATATVLFWYGSCVHPYSMYEMIIKFLSLFITLLSSWMKWSFNFCPYSLICYTGQSEANLPLNRPVLSTDEANFAKCKIAEQ